MVPNYAMHHMFKMITKLKNETDYYDYLVLLIK